MKLFPATAILALVLLAGARPSYAQLSYARADHAAATREAHDPETELATPSFRVVHGVVQGQRGVLAGATVWLKGTRTIAVTNAEGEFQLRVPAKAKLIELTCSYGGLQEVVLRVVPAEALGSVYLLRSSTADSNDAALGK